MNFFRPRKSFHEIIAPVSGIISDLEQYEQDQVENIEHEKALILKLQTSVNDRKNGISQSSHVRGNIAAILKFPDPKRRKKTGPMYDNIIILWGDTVGFKESFLPIGKVYEVSNV